MKLPSESKPGNFEPPPISSATLAISATSGLILIPLFQRFRSTGGSLFQRTEVVRREKTDVDRISSRGEKSLKKEDQR